MTPEAAAKYKRKLGEYLPAVSVDAVFDFMVENAVQFRITRERTSKLGDYRWPRTDHPYHEISINGDLNPQYFLLVLLHEMGHLSAWLRYRNKIQPHGHEWQEEYRQHIIVHLELGAFDAEPAKLLKSYVRRIPLNHATGNKIEELLRRLQPDFQEEELLLLNDLEAGARFVLKSHPDQVFVAQEKRRTRWKCRSEKDGQMYLVNGAAPVIKL